MNPANWKPPRDLTSWFFDLAGNSTSPEAKGARSLAILVTWSLWCERNRRIFNDEVKTPSRIIEEIKDGFVSRLVQNTWAF
ncbi:putative retrotransposon protein [Panicum miliaceum]|uniref:Retrotransposon protein n=1 Tax=Panicum miliaceum TaxID=4540 RepID=A0A3L6PXR5_PANMI|nr:putative retrotransposon protein [Panicum miliaceum]